MNMGDIDKTKYFGLPRATFYRKRKRQRVNMIQRNILVEKECSENHVQAIEKNGAHRSHENDTSVGMQLPETSTRQVDRTNNSPADVDISHARQSAMPFSLESKAVDHNFSDPALLKLCSLAQRHQISDVCLEEILKLLHDPDILSTRQSIPKSIRGFESACGISNTLIKIGWKCPGCDEFSIKETYQGCQQPNIQCCNRKICYNEDHFIVFSVKQVFQIAMPSLVNDYTDESFDEIRVILNTDGAPLFKGSNSSIWPILCVVDKTLFKSQKHNVILLGVWVGKMKPNFDAFLKPILNELTEMYQVGFEWRFDSHQVQSKLKVIAVLCDSIARPLVQQMSQFNARYGCPYCYHEESGHYYSHANKRDIKLRESFGYDLDCIRVITRNVTTSHGVKGSSPFTGLPYFDIIFGFPPDVLHAVYLGVTKQLTEAWISSSNKHLPYYIKPGFQDLLNKQLLMIKPPNRVSRVPRSLEYIKFYKGHEFMMWLLYYSPVLLLNVLEPTYYHHWLLLVRAISLLNSEKIKEDDTSMAEYLLEEFSSQILDLYGRTHQRFNIHLLLHLGLFVRKFGPLYIYSMTNFESFNGQLQKYVKSSFGVGRQICKRYIRDATVKMLANKTVEKNYDCLGIFEYLPAFSENLILQTYDNNAEGFEYFSAIKLNGKYIHTMRSSRSTKRNNTYFFVGDHVFQARVFARQRQTKLVYAIGEEFTVAPSHTFNLPHCFKIISCDSKIILVPTNVKLALKISTDDHTLFFRFLNEAEAVNE